MSELNCVIILKSLHCLPGAVMSANNVIQYLKITFPFCYSNFNIGLKMEIAAGSAFIPYTKVDSKGKLFHSKNVIIRVLFRKESYDK